MNPVDHEFCEVYSEKHLKQICYNFLMRDMHMNHHRRAVC